MKCLYRGYVYEAVELDEMAFASTSRLRPGENPVQFSSLVDNKSRFELDASKMKLDLSKTDSTANFDYIYDGDLGSVLEYPDLFKYYPDAANIELDLMVGRMADLKNGNYYNGGNAIVIKRKTLEGALDTLEHEIQHYIQKVDGFERGGSPTRMNDSHIDEVERKFYEMFKNRMDIISEINTICKYVAEESIPPVESNSFDFKPNRDERNNISAFGDIQPTVKNFNVDLLSRIRVDFKERLASETALNNLIDRYNKVSSNIETLLKSDKIYSADNKPALNSYARIAGEAEARVAAGRRKLTMDQRAVTPIDITDGYALSRIIKTTNGPVLTKVSGKPKPKTQVNPSEPIQPKPLSRKIKQQPKTKG